jgi:Na+-driven multidrug efflux pump
MAHNWLNIAMQAPKLLMPVVVTALISSRANAAFYAAWTLIAFLYIIPTHLSTVLYAIGAGREAELRDRMRFTLAVSAAVGGAGAVVLAIGAHPALSMFGPEYAAKATVPLQVLVLGLVPTIAKTHYIAICRVRERLVIGSLALTLCAAVEVGVAAVGAHQNGLTGLCVALVAAMFVDSAWMGVVVARTAKG